MKRLFLAPTLAVLLVSSAGHAASRPSLNRAIALFTDLEDERAEQMFRKLLKGAAQPADLPLIHVYLGLIALNALRVDEARSEFRQALKLNPTIELPRDAPPKARAIFSQIANETVPALAPPQTTPPLATAPLAPAPETSAPPLVVESIPAPPPDKPHASHVASITTAAVAVATLGGGITFALLGESAFNQAQAKTTVTVGSQQQLLQQTGTDRLIADICYGAAGAAAITAAVVFFFAERPADDTSASVAPASHGATLLLQGRF